MCEILQMAVERTDLEAARARVARIGSPAHRRPESKQSCGVKRCRGNEQTFLSDKPVKIFLGALCSIAWPPFLPVPGVSRFFPFRCPNPKRCSKPTRRRKKGVAPGGGMGSAQTFDCGIGCRNNRTAKGDVDCSTPCDQRALAPGHLVCPRGAYYKCGDPLE